MLLHVFPYRDQGSLEAKGILFWARVLRQLVRDSLPVAQDSHVILVDLAIGLVNSREIDLADEVDHWRFPWVVGSAFHLELVDPVLVLTLFRNQQRSKVTHMPILTFLVVTYVRWPPDRSRPVCHVDVLGILKAVRAGSWKRSG